jgi:transposase-like protein
MKWKHRESIEDLSCRHKEVHSTVLSKEEEAICVAFRKHSLLPLDDCLYALQKTIPHLSRSSLHRLFQRNGISVLPQEAAKKRVKQKFADYEIGYFHVDITEIYSEEGKLYLFVGIDRVSKFAYIEVHKRMRNEEAMSFLKNLIKAVPYKIHRILTDNGAQFTNKYLKTKKAHEFDSICSKNGIIHKLTKVAHPWTNGQVERMNRTIKDATVKKYYYENSEQLGRHINDFVRAYNFGKRLRALKGLTPFEFAAKNLQKDPQSWAIFLGHNEAGPNSRL